MSDDRVIRASENRRVRWANGLGWTREIVRVPDHADWDWRLSIAESDRAAAFSELPGIDRELMLLRGKGIALRFEDGETVPLRRFDSMRFAGERRVTGMPIDGPTEQLNLMWRRGRVDAGELCTVSDDACRIARLKLTVGATTTDLIHVLAGELDYAHEGITYRLGAGDSLQLDGR